VGKSRNTIDIKQKFSSTSTMSHISYRPDIDGLRAIAVLSVILFHAGLSAFGGGYVGVDVFFVISGFLITSLIIEDLERGIFTLSGFWERRFRRILPALTVVIVATLIAGWFLYLPADYEALGLQALTQSFFSSNILFYKQAGYFDTESHLKPLLHTWSLAVEEQYYLFFPLASFAVWKRGRKAFAKFLIISTIVSFVFCLLVFRNNPDLTFYMLPFRGWELLVGSLLAFYSSKAAGVPQRVRELLSLSGIVAIACAVFLYTEDTPFPGYTALLPCLGAAAIIFAGIGGKSAVSQTLSFRPLVFIGLVSYAWYLWHWPVIVFVKYLPFIEFSTPIAAVCVVVSFVLAVLTWKFVETPFRQRKILPDQRSLFLFSLTILVLLAVTGAIIWQAKGLSWRLGENVLRYASGITDYNPKRDQCDKMAPEKVSADGACTTLSESNVQPDFLLWGDSHADSLAPAFYELSDKYKRNGYVITHQGCPPIVDFRQKNWSSDMRCFDLNQEALKIVQRKNIKDVYIVASWNTWVNHMDADPDSVDMYGHENIKASLQDTIDSLRKAGAKVYLLSDIPSAKFDVSRIRAMETLFGVTLHKLIMSKDEFMQEREKSFLPLLSDINGITLIDPLDHFCSEDAGCLTEKDGYSFYFNPTHVSVHGALHAVPVLEKYFKTP
jgi:peptidoglycan/LPS O-acetylase OafA/YrhL